MDYIINGGKRLLGEICVYGAKNCVLPLLGASVLTDEDLILHNCPKITDVLNMLSLLESMGKRVAWKGNTIVIGGRLTSTQAPSSLARLLRGSNLVLGSALTKYGELDLPLPGGCAIGARPMDIHLDGLERMGAEITCANNVLHCKGKLKGANYAMRFASVGATENLVCAAALAEGETVLQECATEPEIEALERLIVAMGGNIEGVGTPNLVIKGVKRLSGAEFDVIPDRIVAATYLACAAASRGRVTVTKCRAEHLRSFLNLLYPHFEITEYSDAITIDCDGQPRGYGRIVTAPYPFFPTDMQSLVLAMASFADGGHTVIRENLFENRLTHIASELAKMGAEIRVEGNVAHVKGCPLKGQEVTAYDLRGGAALIVAALNAEGQTRVRGAENVCRGYLDIVSCLASLGADISKTS